MNLRILNQICYFIQTPDKLLSSSKCFTIKRFGNIRWKNRIYFKDNRIKIINCKDPQNILINCKEIWYNNHKVHRDDIDSKTGLTLPAEIWENDLKYWYNNHEVNRDDIDPKTGLTLPAEIWNDRSKLWYKYGKWHRDDIDPETGITLPAEIMGSGSKYWYKDEELHCDDIDPDTGFTLPAEISANGSKQWYIYGFKFYPNFERIYSLVLRHKNTFLISICAILPILYFINKNNIF